MAPSVSPLTAKAGVASVPYTALSMKPSHVRRISGLGGGLSPQPQRWSSYSSFRSPRKILTKMNAFEAFSSNLEAEPLQRSGGEPPENFDKNECFEAFSSNLQAGTLQLYGDQGAEPPENIDKNECF